MQGLVRDAQVGKGFRVEALAAEEHLFDEAEESAGLGALDDAVVVGRGERDDLADRELREGLGRHRAELARVFHRAGRDDETLARHQARH